MSGARLKSMWRSGQTSFGAWISIGDPSTTEIMAAAGFDWVLFDGEHAPIPVDRLQSLLMAFNGTPTLPVYRVAANDPVQIGQVLDIGAAGVVVPRINSLEQAQAAIAAAMYPPLGRRGVGPWRAAAYGTTFHAYLRRANEETLLMLMMESLEGIAALPEIVQLPGIDAIIVGPADLAASLGVLPDFEHPLVLEAIDRILAICEPAGMPAAVSMGNLDRLTAWRGQGANLMIVGVDSDFILAGADAALHAARSALAERYATANAAFAKDSSR
ncbi:MAG: hypothetical protein IT334_11885 [Thermomicrobiales bacterium]|nr:hypothetical protein [Thermomicrobiales bacterium]